jgi:hypothetical protein
MSKDYKEKDKEKDKKKAKAEYKDELDVLNEKIKELSNNQKQIPIKVTSKPPVEVKKVQVESKSIMDFFT